MYIFEYVLTNCNALSVKIMVFNILVNYKVYNTAGHRYLSSDCYNYIFIEYFSHIALRDNYNIDKIFSG